MDPGLSAWSREIGGFTAGMGTRVTDEELWMHHAAETSSVPSAVPVLI
jgi:hypothetical protein